MSDAVLDKNYWHDRWQNSETGWDIGAPTPPIAAYIDQLNDREIKILVPGSGNGYEVEYLWRKGFKNVYIADISPLPLELFKKRVPDFPEAQIICGDFFEITDQFDIIFEHTFFCALNPSMRSAYARHMAQLLGEKGKLVGLLFTFPLTEKGPPFGGSLEEYKSLFDSYFEIAQAETTTLSIKPRLGNELFIELIKKS